MKTFLLPNLEYDDKSFRQAVHELKYIPHLCPANMTLVLDLERLNLIPCANQLALQ